jgi:Protein of unknown function (DUF2971)
MSLSSAARLLTEGCVRFTQPGDFNDPFEMNPSFDLMSKQDLAALPDAPESPGMKILTPEALQSMLQAIQPGLQRAMSQHTGHEGAFSLRNNDLAQYTLDAEFGVLCLSETADNLLMWAHYADNHRGVTIQFESEHTFFSEGELGFDLPNSGRVEYADKRPILSHSNLRSPRLLFRKSPEWSYEKEWRFIKKLSDADRVVEGTPHAIHLFGIPPEVITGIVIGCGAAHEDRVHIMELAQTPPLSAITIYQTRLHDEKYELEIHPPLDGRVDPMAVNGRICSARESDEPTR